MEDERKLAIEWIDEVCLELEKKQDWSMIKKLEAVKRVIKEDMIERYINEAL
ncbi:MAG TPA: hypothetical protein VNX68_11445 [Nitrosopumilaceae archaeon]|jgi:hypothetical protein|nr:hypothetical protein [Nitrosopumilaceae archaeon]